MKFKNFWSSYIDLCKHSIKWFKDYWFLSGVFVIIGFALFIIFPFYVIGYVEMKKLESIRK